MANVECQVIASKSNPMSDKLDAMRSLSRVFSPCIIPTLRTVAAQRIPVLSLAAEDELAKRDDTHSLRASIDDALSEQGNVPEYLRSNILHSIGIGTKDPAAIALLAPLTRSAKPEARIAAAYALKGIGTQACAPMLKALLSDESQRVRYIAVTGLADISGMPEMHPSISEFQVNEGKYTSYWR